MKNSLVLMESAFAIFITCLLISLALYGLEAARGMSSASTELLNEERNEFLQSDLTVLEGTALPGSSVVSAIKKYQNKLPVKVVTVRGGSSTYSKNHILMNTDPNDVNYIRADGSFVCTHEENLNKVITQLNFVEQGVNSGAVDVTNIDDAKLLLVDALQGISDVNVSQGWQELTDKVRSELSVYSKTQLASALGARYTDTDSWDTLSTAATVRIQELESQISTDETNAHDAQESVCFSMASCALNFNPTVISVSEQDSTTKYFFQDGKWYENGSEMQFTPFTIQEGEDGGLYFYNGLDKSIIVKAFK